MQSLAHEVIYYNFEWDREQELAAQADSVTVLPLFEEEFFSYNGFASVEFPDADTMKQFDTLEIDLTLNCKEGNDCPASVRVPLEDLAKLVDTVVRPIQHSTFRVGGNGR